MKNRSIILTFVPWILFSILPPYTGFTWAASIALILNIVFARKDLLEGVVLEIGGALFFAAMVVVGLVVSEGDTFTKNPNLWSNLAMTLIMLGSVLLNKPFTQQYARGKGSHRLHLQLSLIWTALLLIATGISVAHVYLGWSNLTSTLGTVIAIVLGIKITKLFPRWFNEKHK